MRGFWTTAELRSRGKSEREIRRAVQQVVLRTVRKGHFATAGALPEVVRAVRVGGVATGTTASRALGIWTPPDPPPSWDGRVPRPPDRLQVAVARNAALLRDPDDASRPFVARDDVLLHWVDAADMIGTDPSRISSPLLLLRHAFLSLPAERALAMLDSALRLRFLRPRDLPALKATLPVRLHPVVDSWDRADSGTETVVRFFLRRLGLHVEVLLPIDGVGTVDLLVEGVLVIEVDGREFHEPDRAFQKDRIRDLAAATGRYRTMRLSWWQVLFDWPAVEAGVLAALTA